MSFANLRISAKFPLVIVTVSLLTALATGITAHTQFSTQLEQFAEEQLVALRESRQAALESYLTSIRQDLDMLASSLLVEKAMVDFTSAWYEIGDEPGGQLQKLYIDDNPHPVGKKADLYNARDGSKYSIRHGFYHRWLRKFLEDRGYYDIFLFTPTGDLIYTVAKEADYATNFEAGGPWADSGLGEVFRAVNDNPTPGFQTFTDFEAYGPSNDAPAGFIAQPVFDGGGTYLGVLAMQMPIGRINQVMQVSAGLGETGEAYMVGADKLMRSDSKFVSDSTILETKVDTEPARKALAGETGVEVVPEHRGMAMVSAFGPLEFMGVRWAVIAEIGQAELLAPVAETGRFMIVAVAVILVLVTAVGIVLARGMSRPIVEMTQNMRRLAAGDLGVEIGSTDRTDEIGEMAGAMNVFKENAVKRRQAEDELARKEAQLRIAMDNMPGGMFMVDENLVIRVFNEQYKKMHDFPDEALQEGASLTELVRVRAERGDYGPGDPEELIEQRMQGYIERMTLRHEEELPNGRVVELLRTPVEGGGVVGIATDITERKRAEAALAEKSAIVELLHKTAADANQAQDVDEAMRGCLDAVCAHTGWPVGHVYVRAAETPDVLVPTDIWHLDEPKRFATFRKVTEKARFEAGVGLPGRVMESGKSAWIVDVTEDPNFPRANQAKDIGVKAGFAVPVLVGDRVVAVFEFFAAEAVEPDVALLDVLDNIGGQVGRVIERKQAEAEVRRSEAILSSVLDQCPVAFSLKDTDRNMLMVNKAVTDWFGNSKEDLIGAASDAINPPDQIDMFAVADNEVLEHQRATKPFEYRDEKPFRAPMDIMVVTFPVLGAQGEMIGVGTIQTDITERKRAEQQLTEAHELITSSIEYASRIQRAALPSDKLMSEALGEHSVIWEPRDVVGGDIYWVRKVEGGHITVVADCTGHGVPGAFLTLIATGALRQAMIECPDGDPAKIIARMNRFVKNSLRLGSGHDEADDGLELGVCRIEKGSDRVTYAGARFSLWKLDHNGAEEIRGDKSAIGYHHVPRDQAFTNHDVALTPGSAYYLFSDGLVDQIGGENRRAFGKKRIIALLEEHLGRPLAEQRDVVMAAFTAYQGDEIRRDDVTFLGFRMRS